MRHLAAVALVFSSTSFAAPSVIAEQADSAKDFSLLVELVEDALAHAADTLYDDEIARISSAELEISVQTSTTTSSGFSLFFLSLGGSIESATTSKITLSYSDIDPNAPYPTSGDYLAVSSAIVSAAKAAAAAPTLSELHITSFVVDLEFLLELAANGGIEVKFSVVDADLGGTTLEGRRNHLRLEFRPPT